MGRQTTGGPKGLGQITDSAQTVSDLNWIIGLIAANGNVRSGTTPERDAIPGAQLYEGALFVNTSTDAIEKYDADYQAWRVLMTDRKIYFPTVSNLTLGQGGQASGTYAVTGGVCHYWITVTLGTGAAATGTIQLGLPFDSDFVHKDVGTFLALNGNSRVMGAAGLQTASRIFLLSTSNVFMSDAAPWAWGGGCEIRAHGSFVLP